MGSFLWRESGLFEFNNSNKIRSCNSVFNTLSRAVLTGLTGPVEILIQKGKLKFELDFMKFLSGGFNAVKHTTVDGKIS